MEPINIFSRMAEPEKVVRVLRDFGLEFLQDGGDRDWTKIVVPVEIEGVDSTLTITHSVEYYSEPNWSAQMAGMRGYFSRFPPSDNREQAMCLTTTFRFSLGTIFEPDFNPEGDVRLDIVFQIAEMLDGVLFTPSGLRDANGRILLSMDEDDHDPEAVWPKVIGRLHIDGSALSSKGEEEEYVESEEFEPPAADRVARRTLALAAVTMRALLEQDAHDPEANEVYQEMLKWLEGIDLQDELEPDEWKVVQRPLGKLQPQDQINATWRFEGLGVLAWALGLFEIPDCDQLVDTNVLLRACGMLDVELSRQILGNPQLRPLEELQAKQKELFALHWRLRNYDLDSKVMDFEEFARKCWFGPLSVDGLTIIDGDLGLFDKRLDQANEEEFSLAYSTARERHLAINWLCDGPFLYSEADEST